MINFLRQLFKKKKKDTNPSSNINEKRIYNCSTISSQRVLVGRDTQYVLYAKDAIKDSILSTAKEFITFNEVKDPINSSITIIGKLHVCNVEENDNRS